MGQPATFSWYPRTDPFALSKFSDKFGKLLSDPLWGDVLKIAVHWLSEVNDPITLEAKIVLSQTALEMLVEAILREHIGRKLPRLGAASKIRDLLSHLGIPVDIPSHLTELRAEASKRKWVDGPEAIVGIRNMFAHPSKDHRQGWLDLSMGTRHEASLLNRHYLALIVLWILGYDGSIADTSEIPLYLGKEVDTPWATGSAGV